jgi:hypothetical protein
MRPEILPAVVIALLFLNYTSAPSKDIPQSPFEFFDQKCLEPGPDFEALLAVASADNWPSLPEDILAALSPFADPTALTGWIASEEQAPVKVVVASISGIGSSLVESCTVGFYGIDARIFEKSLLSRFGPGAEEQQDKLDRRNEVFKASSSSGTGELIRLSLPKDALAPDQVIATVISEPRP